MKTDFLTILGIFWRKSENSPDSDPKIEVLGSENPKIDPYRNDSEDSRRQKSGGRKSSTKFPVPKTSVYAGQDAHLDIVGTTKYPGLHDLVIRISLSKTALCKKQSGIAIYLAARDAELRRHRRGEAGDEAAVAAERPDVIHVVQVPDHDGLVLGAGEDDVAANLVGGRGRDVAVSILEGQKRPKTTEN